jgi:hypothetical protein
MLRQTRIPLYLLASVALGLSACKTQLPIETDDLAETGDVDPDAEVGDPTPSDPGDDESETGSIFVPDVEGDEPSCDPFAQDCVDGEKCVHWGSTGGNWDANKCVPVTGSGTVGDACSYAGVVAATDDCDASSHCWDVQDVDGQLVGTCTAFCAGTPNSPQCEPDTACLIANEGSITLCIETCDPLLQACSEGLGCFWANNDFQCIFTTQNIPLGEPCGYINDCAAGNTCLDAEVLPGCNGSACCGSFCDLDDPTCGLEGTECSAFFEEGMAPPGYEGVGVCIVPGA